MVDTGNALYPFSFKELPGCGGLTDVEMAVTDVNASGQYVYTTSGMQLVTGQGASTVMPELTDFLSGTQYEYWNGEEIRSVTLSGSNLYKKLNIIADRYLDISTLTCLSCQQISVMSMICPSVASDCWRSKEE